MSSKIAIVGLSALFPGAPNVNSFYKNIINRSCSIGDADKEWLQGSFTESPVNQPGRIRSKLRAGLGNIAFFDPLKYGIMPKSIDGGDPDHYLSLRVASEALLDSCLPAHYVHTSTGVVVGRGTYFNRGFGTVYQHGIIIDQTVDILKEYLSAEQLNVVKGQLVRSLPDFNSDMVGGVVPNIVSGRIANKLGLGGPNFLIDAACASSLIAVEHACEQLTLRKADLMLVGGVQASTPPEVHMVFDLLDALAQDQLTPFSKQAQGTVLSEGVGFVVLCRLADAERLNLRVYATIETVASSSDGRGKGLFAPSSDGQQLAIRRAYEKNETLQSQVRYLETHGTGMPLGDETELRTVIAQFFDHSSQPQLHLGNLKSLIGHCIPASGIAGLISATLAVRNGVFPPFNIDEPIDILNDNSSSFQVSAQPQPWLGNKTSLRTAAVNAFGFGGINSHLVVQQYIDDRTPGTFIPDLIWPTAIFFLAAKSVDALLDAIDSMLTRIDETCFHTMALESFVSAQAVGLEIGQTMRGYVVATGPKETRERLLSLRTKLAERSNGGASLCEYSHRRGHSSVRIISHSPEKSKPVFVYPGEGSQSAGMLRELALYFPIINNWISSIAQSLNVDLPLFESILHLGESGGQLPEGAYGINISTGLVFAANMSINQLFYSWGIRPAAHVGHSTGQNSALFAGNWLQDNPDESVLKRACSQVVAMRNAWNKVDASAELDQRHAVYVLQQPDIEALTRLCKSNAEDIVISMRNCPEQYVVVIPKRRCAELQPQLQNCCVLLLEMPISRPYHTKYCEEASHQMRQYYEQQVKYNECSSEPVYSCTSGHLIESRQQAQHELAFLMQSPVDFERVVMNLIQDGYHLFLECGHGSSATNFVRSISKSEESVDILTAQSSSRAGLGSFLQSVAALWSMGNTIDSQYIKHQAKQEQTIFGGFKKQHTEVCLNLLMPRAQLDIAPSSSADATSPKISRQKHSESVTNHTPTPEVQASSQGWTTRVNISQKMPVLSDHTLPNRNTPNDRIPSNGLSVVPMAAFVGLAISASKKIQSSDVVELKHLKMSQWAEATESNDFSIQFKKAESGYLDCRVEHNQHPTFFCVIEQGGAHREGLGLSHVPFKPASNKQPYIWAANELYLHGMFHGPFYQVIKEISHCQETELEGILETTTNSTDLNTLQILDGLAQTSAFWAAPSHGLAFHTFPLEIGELTIGTVSPLPSRYKFLIRNTIQNSSILGFDGVLIDANGAVILTFKDFRHSLVKLPQSYHACFANCEKAFYSQRLATTPQEISISVIDSTQNLDAYDNSNGFFPAIFSHMWFNEPELKPLGSAKMGSSQMLTYLSRKECMRYLLEQLDSQVRARQLMTDSQGNIHYFDSRTNCFHQLPSPTTLWHQGRCISIGSLTHKVAIISVTPVLGRSDLTRSQPQNDPKVIVQYIESALEALLGTQLTIDKLTNVTVNNPATIQATYQDLHLTAGVFRLGENHYSWAGVKK